MGFFNTLLGAAPEQTNLGIDLLVTYRLLETCIPTFIPMLAQYTGGAHTTEVVLETALILPPWSKVKRRVPN